VNESDKDSFTRESLETEAFIAKPRTAIKWTKVDYLWSFLGAIGIILVVKGVFVLADAKREMQNPSRYNPAHYGCKTLEELTALFHAYDWPSISDFWMPTTVAIIFGFIEAACMKCGLPWARRL